MLAEAKVGMCPEDQVTSNSKRHVHTQRPWSIPWVFMSWNRASESDFFSFWQEFRSSRNKYFWLRGWALFNWYLGTESHPQSRDCNLWMAGCCYILQNQDSLCGKRSGQGCIATRHKPSEGLYLFINIYRAPQRLFSQLLFVSLPACCFISISSALYVACCFACLYLLWFLRL